jgi:ribonucleoside-diphosphate reductase alpha chain
MSERKRLPDRRKTERQKAWVNGQSIYLDMGHYPDGSLGEIFVDVHRSGSAFRGLMDGMARLFSISLQYQVPLEQLVAAIKGIDFPPHGPVSGSENVKEAVSLLDYVAKELEATYLAEPVPEKVAGKYEQGSGV